MSHTTELDICNSALAKLGGERITSLTAQNKRARLCNQQYSKMRDKLLRMHPWNFALERVTLTPEATTPKFGFHNQFQLPADLLRVYKIDNPNVFYKVEEDRLLSNETSMNLVYVKRVTNVAAMDSTFQEILVLLLAADISYALVQSGTLTRNLWEQYREEMREVRSIDAQEEFPDSLQPDNFTRSRSINRLGFDPTRLG